MGRRRKKEIKPGTYITLYIPVDVDPDVLEFYNEQDNISKTINQISYTHVHGQNKVEKKDIQKMISDEIKKQLEKQSEVDMEQYDENPSSTIKKKRSSPLKNLSLK